MAHPAAIAVMSAVKLSPSKGASKLIFEALKMPTAKAITEMIKVAIFINYNKNLILDVKSLTAMANNTTPKIFRVMSMPF